jgi:hypothetical protein
MKSDLPTPEAILEELADKVAVQIDRMTPVAFDGALHELTRYHSFLLAVSASKTLEGAPFSYAEVAGNAWHAPHLNWIRQYRRLFERAAGRLPEDSYFLRRLAYTPRDLLSWRDGAELSAEIIRAILDLGPMLMDRVEHWITKRTTIGNAEGEPAAPRLKLAGSDARAYANVLPELVGAWEAILRQVPSLHGWPGDPGEDEDATWSAFRASWPLLWQHLTNTAYCAVVAVWNEDEVGAALYGEALVRWPETLHHDLEAPTELTHHRLLFPSILELGWAEACERVAPLTYDFMPAPTAWLLFASVVRGIHDDVVLLTASLVLHWSTNNKQLSDIGAKTARALLDRKSNEAEPPLSPPSPLGLRSVFFDLMRQEIAAEGRQRGSYAGTLDSFVAKLDNMTERRVVPGRVFTPTTLHDRGDLLSAFLAILAAVAPAEGDDGLVERIEKLAREEDILPQGDRSLRHILDELRRYKTMLEAKWPQIEHGVHLLAPGRDVGELRRRLVDIVRSAESVIESQRLERLKARSIDPTKIEAIRVAVESALLHETFAAPFLRGAEVVRASGEEGKLQEVPFIEVLKAQLTDPPMDHVDAGFEAYFASRTQRWAARMAWSDFTERARKTLSVSAAVDEPAFWREIASLARQVGPEPVLLVSLAAEARALRRVLYRRPEDRADFEIEHISRADRVGPYIATVQGIDVYGADLPAGTAWLFSARTLLKVGYADVEPGMPVTVAFETSDDLKGTLRVRLRQRLEWAETPTFELRLHRQESEGG